MFLGITSTLKGDILRTHFSILGLSFLVSTRPSCFSYSCDVARNREKTESVLSKYFVICFMPVLFLTLPHNPQYIVMFRLVVPFLFLLSHCLAVPTPSGICVTHKLHNPTHTPVQPLSFFIFTFDHSSWAIFYTFIL